MFQIECCEQDHELLAITNYPFPEIQLDCRTGRPPSGQSESCFNVAQPSLGLAELGNKPMIINNLMNMFDYNK